MKIPIWLNPFVQRKVRRILEKAFEGTPIVIDELGSGEYLSDTVSTHYVRIHNVDKRIDVFFSNKGIHNWTNGFIRFELEKELVNLKDFNCLDQILPDYEVKTIRLIKKTE